VATLVLILIDVLT